jgi:hypothetical protein
MAHRACGDSTAIRRPADITLDDDLPTATRNAGLARNSDQQRRYERIDEILAQRQPTRTLKDREAREGEGPHRDTMKASDRTFAKKHHPDQIDALLRKM